jgi:hypothetical protein
MKKMPTLPFIVYLTSKGLLGFEQNIDRFESIKSSSVDIWVINDPSQFLEIQKCQRLYLYNNNLGKIVSSIYQKLKPGTQILYLPQHLKDEADIRNTQIQFGFVTSKKNEDQVYCRYYNVYDLTTLRTLSCSERADIRDIFILNTMKPEIVKYWLSYISEEDKKYKSQKEETWLRLQR